MRKGICFCLLMCSALLFAGCLGKIPEEDTISVDKKGRVTSTIVEDFDKEFYDAEELESEIDAELAEYNQNFAADHIRKAGEYVDPEGNPADVETVSAGGEAHVLILEEAVQAEVPGKILAVSPSEHVTVTGSREASVSEAELSYIIYK